MKKITQSIAAFLRQLDLFGHPVNLNIKGDSHFKTAFGGFSTLVLYFICSAYLATMIIQLANYEAKIETNTKYIDLSKEAPMYNLN